MYSSIPSIKNAILTRPFDEEIQNKEKISDLKINELREFWEDRYIKLHSKTDNVPIDEKIDLEELEKFELQFEALWPEEPCIKFKDQYDKLSKYLVGLCYIQMLRIQMLDQLVCSKFLNEKNIDKFSSILEKSRTFYENFEIKSESSGKKINLINIRRKFEFYSFCNSISVPPEFNETSQSFYRRTSLLFSEIAKIFLIKCDFENAENFLFTAKEILNPISPNEKPENKYIYGYLETIHGNIALHQGKFRDAKEKSINAIHSYTYNDWGFFEKHGLVELNYLSCKSKNSKQHNKYIEKNIEKYLDFPLLPPTKKDYIQTNSSNSYATAWPSGKIEIDASIPSFEKFFDIVNSLNKITSVHHLVFCLKRTEDINLQQELFKLALHIKKKFFSFKNITRDQIQEVVALASIPDPNFYYELISETLRRINNTLKDDEYINLTQGLLAMLRARPLILLEHPELEEDFFLKNIESNYLPKRIQQSKMSIKTLKEQLIEITKTNAEFTRTLSKVEKDFGTAKPFNDILVSLWSEIEKLKAPEAAEELLEGMHASAQLKTLTEFVSLKSNAFQKFLGNLCNKLVSSVEDNNIFKVKSLLHIICQFLDIAVTLLPKEKPITDIETRKNFDEIRIYLLCFAQQDNLELKHQAIYALEALQYILPENSYPSLTNEQYIKVRLFALQLISFSASHDYYPGNAQENIKNEQAGLNIKGRELTRDMAMSLISQSEIFLSNKDKLSEIKHAYHAWYPALWVVHSLLEKRDYIKLRTFIEGSDQRDEPAFLWGVYRYFKQIAQMPEATNCEEDRKIAISYLKTLASGGEYAIREASRNVLQALGISDYGAKLEQENVDKGSLVLPPCFWRSRPASTELLEQARRGFSAE